LPGTEGAESAFWSPDSRSIGFLASGKMYRMDITGGRPQALANVPDSTGGEGGAWNADGTILCGGGTVGPLFRIPVTGGEPVAVTTLHSPSQFAHHQPHFLPDGRHFVFYAAGRPEAAGLYLGSLDG